MAEACQHPKWKKSTQCCQGKCAFWGNAKLIATVKLEINQNYMSCGDSGNPVWTDRIPTLNLRFEWWQSGNVFYYLWYGIPDFVPEIWYRLPAIFFSINMIKLKFCFCLMSKIIRILRSMKTFINCTDSPLFTLNTLISGGFFRES